MKTLAVSELCWVDVESMAEWVLAIPFEEWPQQHRVHPDRIRPAMVNRREWHGFGSRADAIVADLVQRGLIAQVTTNPMLSVVMPGAGIEPHVDDPGPRWCVRVHVPLSSNDAVYFLVDEERYPMDVGRAYLVDVRRRHEIRNDGMTPRIHLMFDVETLYEHRAAVPREMGLG
jgi:hypothetical protein